MAQIMLLAADRFSVAAGVEIIEAANRIAGDGGQHYALMLPHALHAAMSEDVQGSAALASVNREWIRLGQQD